MKTSAIIAVVIVCFLVAGAGAATVITVQSSSAETIAAIKARDVEAAGAIQALRDEIASVRRGISELKTEPGKIYVASRPASAGGSGADDSENADSPENAPIKGAAKPADYAVMGKVDAGATEVVKEAVRQVLAEEKQREEDARKKEQEARMAEFQDRMKARMDEETASRADALVKELNLTPAQEDRVKAALEERKNAMLAMFSQRGGGRGGPGGPPPDSDRNKWMEAEKKFQDEMANILTQDQLAIYKEKNLGGMGPVGGWGGPGGGGTGGPGGGGGGGR
jgi:uncharacterized membrane protein YgcG